MLASSTTMGLYYDYRHTFTQSCTGDQQPACNPHTHNVVLLHDSVRPHKARAVTRYLERQKDFLPHPLLPLLEDRLADRMFSRIQDLVKVVNLELEKRSPKKNTGRHFPVGSGAATVHEC